MVKKINTIISLFCIISSLTVVIVGCSYLNEDSEVDAKGEDAFVEVADDGMFTEYRHKETGCHYLYMNGSTTETVTQMFVDANGETSTKPYCD